MISNIERTAIQAIARKYHATRILLFGSALSETQPSRDIDLAVDGVADADFFAFHGELLRTLSRPVDVVDLAQKTKFTDVILSEGVSLDG